MRKFWRKSFVVWQTPGIQEYRCENIKIKEDNSTFSTFKLAGLILLKNTNNQVSTYYEETNSLVIYEHQ